MVAMVEQMQLAVVIAAGLAFGSFSCVCICRLPRARSIVWPRSACPGCHKNLIWFDNVPVISYLLLGGKCRSCRKKISLLYPSVELTISLLFLFQYWYLGWQSLLLVRLAFACAMVILCVIDWQERVLPNVITLPGIAFGLGSSAFLDPGFLDSFIGCVTGAFLLLSVRSGYYAFRREHGLGMGDVKMLAMIGAFLGWQPVLLVLFVAAVGGSVIGVCLMITGTVGSRYPLPFGSFLAVSALVVSIAGEGVLDWYLSWYL
tara:strand:+ start:7361 stop:8140 length:780 start_codon:yes stop_codon:yes gene_type:complete